MKDKIKNLRLEIDALAQLVSTMRKALLFRALLTDGIAIKSCQQSLLFSKAWLGKALGAIGEESPYKNDGQRKDVKDIEPTSDKNDIVFSNDIEKVDFETMNYVEKIDFCREKIRPVIDTLFNIIGDSHAADINISNNSNDGTLFMSALLFSYQHLCESRFHLGFELEQIREKSISRSTDIHG